MGFICFPNVWVVFFEGRNSYGDCMWRIYVGIVLCVLGGVTSFPYMLRAQEVAPAVALTPPAVQRVIIVLKSSLAALNHGVRMQPATDAEHNSPAITETNFCNGQQGLFVLSHVNLACSRWIVATVATKDIATLQADPLVESVQIDRLSTVNLNNSTDLIGSVAGNSAGYGGDGATVAVLDTGVDKNHPFLARPSHPRSVFFVDSHR
jgi:subtilisin family serine protease